MDRTKPLSPRRGIAVTITLDPEAARILDALSPGRKCMGRTVSQLLHSEMIRREEKTRLKEVLERAWSNDVQPVAHA